MMITAYAISASQIDHEMRRNGRQQVRLGKMGHREGRRIAAMTPLLGRFMLVATGQTCLSMPLTHWTTGGQGGRRFKSGRPDKYSQVRVGFQKDWETDS
jgi:hypothetical protein